MRSLLLLLLILGAITTVASAAERENIALTKSNHAVLSTEFSMRSVGKVLSDITKLDTALPKGVPIYLVLDTPGGSVFAGIHLIDMLNAMDRPIHTITIFAASMGFHTVQGLGTRYVLPSGVLMSHLAFGGTNGNMPGSANTRLTFFTKVISNLDKVVVGRNPNITIEEYRDVLNREIWDYGQDVVDAGYADGVANVTCSAQLVDYGRCPLIPGAYQSGSGMALIERVMSTTQDVGE